MNREDRAPRYAYLPVRREDLDKPYTPNDLPGDLLICRDLPSATPPEAYEFPGPLVDPG